MNNYDYISERRRHRQLFIVEGHHEKDKLLNLLLYSFPELSIDMDDIIIYESNIYNLYHDIEKEYLDDWNEQDVDLPYILSKKNDEDKLNKNDFTNILIVFDYERQDSKFTEDKINKMQEYFNDVADVGQLYINYPMIESYQHFSQIPDLDFIDKKITAALKKGKEYKKLVINNPIAKLVNFKEKMYGILKNDFDIKDDESLDLCVEEILKKQNEFSRDVYEGYIWILNTCVFFIPEYDYSLLSEDK